MAAQSRPSLTTLADRMSKKDPVAAPLTAEAEQSSPAPASEVEAKDRRVQVLVRMTPAERKALRQIALDRDTTVQALVEDTIRDLLRRHGSMPA